MLKLFCDRLGELVNAREYRAWLVLLVPVLVSACGAAPVRHMQALAQANGLQEAVVSSGKFDHRVYRNLPAGKTRELNVYLEGDGAPWLFRYIVMPDPTPRRPMMLSMMAEDPYPSFYLGRPCYNGFAKRPECDSKLWTSGRYSRQVVNSMAIVLEKEIEKRSVEHVNLFGHSGGGALAVLLASRIPQTRFVVSLAGNLDIDAWTTRHGYSPLFSSLNPARSAPLSADIVQVHLMGGQDHKIPPELVKPWVIQQQNTYGVVFENYDHSCCWSKYWQALLRQIRSRRVPLEFPVQPFVRPSREILLKGILAGKGSR